MKRIPWADGEARGGLPAQTPTSSVRVYLPIRHPSEVLHNHTEGEGYVYAGYSEVDPNQHLWRCPREGCPATRAAMCVKKVMGRECSTCRSY